MKIYFLLFLSIFFLSQCQEKNNTKKENQPQNNQTQKTDFNPAFKIEKFSDYQLFTIYLKDKKDSVVYAFVNKNKKNNPNIPTKNIIKTPIKKIVTFSHTHLACIEKLEQNSTILGVTEGAFLQGSKWEKSIQNKEIKDLGTGDESVKEKIIAIKPEIVLVSNAADIDKLKTLEKFNIQTILNVDWLETHPVGRAAWIKLFGLLFESEKESENIFQNIEKEYNEIKKIAKNKTKKVTILTDMPFRGTWYLAGGKSYTAKFIEDAGGDFIGKDNNNTASIPTTIENLYTKGKNADIWLNVGQAKTLKEVAQNDERLTNFMPYQQKKIYNYGADYWLTSIINPQEILADMLHIFHPELLKDRKMKYYKKLE